MKCEKCEKDAIIEIKRKHKYYCPEHFNKYFTEQVKNLLENKNYGIKKSDKICVGLSGGKDSAVALYVLKNLGYDCHPIYLNLGIPEFSDKSLKKCEEICKFVKIDLKVINLKGEYKFSLPELLKKHPHKAPCKACGTIKRYVFNKFAYENNFDYIATGHNLSDITAQGLNTLMSNYFMGFKNLSPVVSGNKELKLCGRLKVLFFHTDDEVKLYAEINKIPFLEDRCPYVADNPPLHRFKKFLSLLEEDKPGTLRRFAFSFIELGKRFERIKEEREKFKLCRICKYPSAANVCYFCKLTKFLRKK